MASRIEVARLIALHGYPTYALSKIGSSAAGNCYIRLSTSGLTIATQDYEEVATWPYSAIRDFNCHDDIFTFTSGRKGPFGVEKYDFQFEPSIFEGFKAALSTATGAKFGLSDTSSNQQYASQPASLPVSASSPYYTPSTAAPTNAFVLQRHSSTSSSCSSSSCSSSSSFAEDYLVPTMRKHLAAASLKRVVHHYEEVDVPADGNGNSPSTSPIVYAPSNASPGDDVFIRNGFKRATSNPSSFAEVALPSAPDRAKSIPLSASTDITSLAQTRTAGDNKLPTLFEGVNPYHNYDFVPLRQSQHSQDSHNLKSSSTQLSFTSASGTEVLYDVPQPLGGGISPQLAPPSQKSRPGIYENIHCGPYENVPPYKTYTPVSNNGNQSHGYHHYVNVVGPSMQLTQDMPITGDGIHYVGKSPFSVATRPSTQYAPRTPMMCSNGMADVDVEPVTLSESDYIVMTPVGAEHVCNGSSPILEAGEEEEGGYVTMRRQTCSGCAREPSSAQQHGWQERRTTVGTCAGPPR